MSSQSFWSVIGYPEAKQFSRFAFAVIPARNDVISTIPVTGYYRLPETGRGGECSARSPVLNGISISKNKKDVRNKIRAKRFKTSLIRARIGSEDAAEVGDVALLRDSIIWLNRRQRSHVLRVV